jgi:hypothetical protein
VIEGKRRNRKMFELWVPGLAAARGRSKGSGVRGRAAFGRKMLAGSGHVGTDRLGWRLGVNFRHRRLSSASRPVTPLDLLLKCNRLTSGYMGRHAIADKLAPKVQEAITTESQVVYILVELRKLLEHDHLKSKYDIINFYGNWVVHTRLEQSAIAEKIVRYFDDLHRLQTGESRTMQSGISRLIGHLPFQTQLRDCLAHFSLPTMLCEDAQFGAFRVQLGQVIKDCPLFIQNRNHQEEATRFIESVTVKTRHDELGRVVFDWEAAFHTEPEFRCGPISMIF